jgi:hypothetical protein
MERGAKAGFYRQIDDMRGLLHVYEHNSLSKNVELKKQ